MSDLGGFREEGHFDAFTDLLFNALLGFAFESLIEPGVADGSRYLRRDLSRQH